MAKRQALNVFGEDTSSPVPAAVKVDNMVYGTRINGRDPSTRRFAANSQAQIEQLFDNVSSAMTLAGGSLDDVVFVGAFLSDLSYRDHLNVPWLRLFPDESNRPSRNTFQCSAMADGEIAFCEFIAVLGTDRAERGLASTERKRQVLKLPGVAEVRNPAPTAARVANYVHCVRVTGQEPGSGLFPSDPHRQISQLFENTDSLLRQAGGSIADLAFIKVSLRTTDGEGLQNVAHRELLNDVWLANFPDRDDRPARHTVPANMPDGRLISASFTGVLSSGKRRRVIDLPELEYTNNPLPLAVLADDMLYTSRIRGRDPSTSKIASTMGHEVDLIFSSLDDILHRAGGSLDDLALMKLFVNDAEHEREFESHWLRLFPDAESRPARYTFYFDDGRPLAGNATVMGEFVAVLD